MMILPSFAPFEIDRSTFSTLLACYPTVAREAFRRKILAKAQRKADREERKKAKKNSSSKGSATPAADDDDSKAELPIPKGRLDHETDVFLKLDSWRYETLPAKLKERSAEKGEKDEKDGSPGLYMEKDELVKLMEWKLKHGVYRPGLEGMIKTNKAALIRKTTGAAFAALPKVEPVLDSSSEENENENSSSLNEAFPKTSLDILTQPLRAVGPATASLVLNVATEGNPNEVPFYSDELYLWLCLGKYPLCSRGGRKKAGKRIRSNGELDVKYNLREYRDLWEAVLKLRNRLNSSIKSGKVEAEAEAEDSRPFTTADIERVAYVLKYLDISGFPNASEILEQDAREQKDFEEEEKETEQEILGVKREAKKRKREEEKEEKEETKKEEEDDNNGAKSGKQEETEDFIPLGGDEEQEQPKSKKRKKNDDKVKEKSSPRKGKIKGKKMKKMKKETKRGKVKK